MAGSIFDYFDPVAPDVLPLGTDAAKPDPTLAEALSAGFQSARAGPDWGLNQSRYEGGVYDEIRDAMRARGYDVGPLVDLNQVRLQQAREARGERPQGLAVEWAARDRTFWSAVAAERKRDPAFMAKYADVRDLVTLREHAIGQRQSDLGAAEDVLSRTGMLGTGAGFVGMIGAGALDPLSYIPIGGGATKAVTFGRQVLGAALREGAANAAMQIAVEPLVRTDAKLIGQERDLGDTLTDTAAAFGFGAVLGGAGMAADRGARLAGDAIASMREAALTKYFDRLPAALQQRMIEAGTLSDRVDIAAARDAIGADRLTPEEIAAFRTVETDADVRESSPFATTPQGDLTHGQRLAASIDALLANQPVPDFPPVPVRSSLPSSSVLSGSADVAGKIIMAESRGNPKARNRMPGQTASGLGQFTDDTWVSGIKQWFPDIAKGKSKAQLIAMKSDPALGRQMTERAVDEYKRMLGNAGLPTSDGNVYLMHFLGPRGIDLIKADPGRAIKGLLPDAFITANPSVLEGKTVGDVIAWADGKMGARRPEAGPGADAATIRPELLAEPGIDIEAARATAFDPLPYRDQARRYVDGKGSLRLDRFAVAMDLPLDQAHVVLAMLARSGDSGLILSRKGVVRRKPVFNGPMDLLTQIADWGGLHDVPSERGLPRDDLAKGMALGQRMTKAGPVLNSKGITIDQLGEKLWTAGWFQERPDSADVLNLLDQAAGGKKIYRGEDQESGLARDRELIVNDEDEMGAAIDGAASVAGIEVDPEIRSRAVELLPETGDAEEALHRAMMEQFDAAMSALAFEADDGYYDRIGDALSEDDWARIEELGNGSAADEGPGFPVAGDRGAEPGQSGSEGQPGDAGRSVPTSQPDGQDGRAPDAIRAAEQADALNGAAEAARFDDPDGEAARLQADNIEHDIRMELAAAVDPAIAERQRQQAALKAASPLQAKAEQDGTMGLGLFDATDQPGFRLAEGGADRSTMDLIDGLDSDVDAWKAIEACQAPPKPKGEG